MGLSSSEGWKTKSRVGRSGGGPVCRAVSLAESRIAPSRYASLRIVLSKSVRCYPDVAFAYPVVSTPRIRTKKASQDECLEGFETISKEGCHPERSAAESRDLLRQSLRSCRPVGLALP